MLRVLLTGGGTGGHVNPAIAIADTIKMNQPDAQIAFVGTKEGKENDLVPRAGYPLYYIESKGIRRSLSPSNIKALFLALTSPYSKKTTNILKEFQPDIVIGTGGYVCWPLLKAAARAKIPTMVHESNCLPGLAVRQLQKCVDTILLNFPESVDLLKVPQKCVVVGNPLRGEFGTIPKADARKKLNLTEEEKLVLCYAGSNGSATANEGILDLFRALAPKKENVRFVLATGVKNYDAAKEIYQKFALDNCPNVQIQPYIYDMPLMMSAADIVISRAGAMSLSELSKMGKASIVIPSPYVADNHQLKNAQAMEERGGVCVVQEKDFPDGLLIRTVEDLLENDEKREALESHIRDFSSLDANRLIYDKIIRAVDAYRKEKSSV